MAILIALFHAVPILAVSLLMGTKTAIFITAAMMLLAALVTGSPDYFFVDAIAVAGGTIIGISINRDGR